MKDTNSFPLLRENPILIEAQNTAVCPKHTDIQSQIQTHLKPIKLCMYIPERRSQLLEC